MERDDRLLYLTSRAQHRLEAYIKARLKAEGIRVSHTQAGILLLLEQKGPLPMSELSRHFEVDNSAITGLVDRLEKAGYATRSPHPTDRRVNLVSVTEAGAGEAGRCVGLAKEANEKVKEGFTEDEVDSYRRVLESILEKFRPHG
ncbi:MAG: MarR family transcriptional regulator [Actinomycetota bacterium]